MELEGYTPEENEYEDLHLDQSEAVANLFSTRAGTFRQYHRVAHRNCTRIRTHDLGPPRKVIRDANTPGISALRGCLLPSNQRSGLQSQRAEEAKGTFQQLQRSGWSLVQRHWGSLEFVGVIPPNILVTVKNGNGNNDLFSFCDSATARSVSKDTSDHTDIRQRRT